MGSPAGAPARPTVVLVAARGTLSGVDALLRRSGARPVRVRVLETRPVPPERWLQSALRAPAPDTIVVTSRAAVDAGLGPWRRAVRGSRPLVEYWAVGPGTAAAVRGVGVRRVRRPPSLGASALVRALRRPTPRTVLYFRSDRAGPAFGASLRRQGHRVVDPVVYRLGRTPPLPARTRAAFRRVALLVVTSPSGLSELRRRLGAAAFDRLARRVPLVVLGAQSRDAARKSGFRRISIAPSPRAQPFTRHLLAELSRAAA